MAGKGAPARFIETSDQLRPQSTSRFNKTIVQTYERNLFPLTNMECKTPLRTMRYEPSSTRAELQNGLFQKRYVNKNIVKKNVNLESRIEPSPGNPAAIAYYEYMYTFLASVLRNR